MLRGSDGGLNSEGLGLKAQDFGILVLGLQVEGFGGFPNMTLRFGHIQTQANAALNPKP